MSDSLVIGDWGGSRLRLWSLHDGAIAGHREGPGISATADPAGALQAMLGDWSPDRILLCGMAGARNGLREAPYADCPVPVTGWSNRAVRDDFHGIDLVIAAGAAWRDPQGRPEVMRGEETQLFGAMALDRALGSGEHLVLLPGTHSKWATLADGCIVGFRTFVTGELYALLGRSSLIADGAPDAPNADDGFAAGLERASAGRELSSDLFEARAAQLVDGKTSGWARGFVSGLLIGAELRAMAPRGRMVVIGEESLSARYAKALATVCDDVDCRDGEDCAIAGLRLLNDLH